METIIVGEIGINANGDINVAKQLIDVCSDLNIPYVKFQKRDIDSCYAKEQLDSYRESPWGKTFRKQKEGLEFSLEQYYEIDNYCIRKGNIDWFASPWDLKSVDFLSYHCSNVPFIKIPSAKLMDMPYLQRCVETNIPIIMSTGMSNLSMIKEAMQIVGDNVKFLLHCTSTYPSKVEDLNLIQIRELNHLFGTDYCKIGFSNHHPSILYAVESVIFGAKMVEVHITLDRCMYGSDQASSIEPQGLKKLVKYIEGTEKAIGIVGKKLLDSEISIAKKLRG